MKTKPNLSFWKLWNLSFGFFGVQIAYALQSANVSRIFSTIGADPHDLSYFWILPPLMGMIVQPIVGTMSDKTWNRFGRRLPYLIVGAIVAVIVMCLLPNAGSFGLGISSAIIFGLISLMLLDTSINMAMQPFKMLVGDMVNEKQKGLAYSIQSFLCNAGSVVGFVFPFLFAWIGIKSTAPDGVVPDTVIWSFYIGAAILMLCVIYSLAKIKEWPPHLYAEYNGGADLEAKTEKKQKTNIVKLLKEAPSTFWTVGLVQFFCWFAFLFMWTYTTNTVATSAFNTPVVEKIDGITSGDKKIDGKFILINDTTVIVKEGKALVQGYKADTNINDAATILNTKGDTIVKDHSIFYGNDGRPVADFNKPFARPGETITVDGNKVTLTAEATLNDYISSLSGDVKFTKGANVTTDHTTGKLTVMEAEEVTLNADNAAFESHPDLDTASAQYSAAGDWVGILFAVQALASVLWAVVLPQFRSRKLSYSLSLLLGGIGFVLSAYISNKYMLFIPFILIGCGWAAMLAWPFTILTNSLKSGNIGTYLGLFNCSICLPQIVAALLGGVILSLFSTPGEIAPVYLMMVVAGVSMIIGAMCVGIIKEGNSKQKLAEDIPASEI
ncbi:MAG: MFS transporter [Prevotella sp.]|nr:MFS transporter [Prevotella sp.]MCM1074068.1 MFS transporter [Ruminococcus sp.]